MAIYGAELPEGAILDEPQEPQGKIYGAELPEGFTLDPVVDAYQNGTLNGRKKQAFEELQRRGQIDINQFLQDVPKTAEQPVSERPFGVAAMTPEQAPMGDMGQPIQPPQEPRQALGTLQRIGEVYPVLETAAEMVTSTYGIPVSGLAGLVALPFGLETSEDVMEKVQKALVYKPQTAGGQELARAAQYPMEKLEGVAAMAGKALEEEGQPELAAAVHSAIVGAPAILGARKTLKTGIKDLGAETKKTIKKGIEKAIRPSVVGKKTRKQMNKYYDDAATAVETIVANSDDLRILDETGAPTGKLPKTLDEFSQSVEQTKRNIFEEYDRLAREGGAATEKRPLSYPLKKKEGEKIVFENGVPYLEKPSIAINLEKAGKQLNSVIKNKSLEKFSPETIEYAKHRKESLKGGDTFSALDTQESIQILNQTLENFYRDPTPALKGKALVDSMIANDLRKQLDAAISRTTGKDYQGVKSKYGALKAIEKDVNRRAIVDARKNNKGLLDFSDIATGGQVVAGMLRADPATAAAGAAGKGLAAYYKMLNDPNKIVETMFKDVEKLSKSQQPSIAPGVAGIVATELAADEGEQ